MSAYGDAWVQEMWPPVRELPWAERARQRVEDAALRERCEQARPAADGVSK